LATYCSFATNPSIAYVSIKQIDSSFSLIYYLNFDGSICHCAVVDACDC
jgi:hypothetical protein